MARRGPEESRSVERRPATDGKRQRLVILLVVAASLVLGGTVATDIMTRDVEQAVDEKLHQIDGTLAGRSQDLAPTEIFDMLRASGLTPDTVVGFGRRYAFSLPVERGLARRCIDVLVDQGVITTKVYDRACHPNDPRQR